MISLLIIMVLGFVFFCTILVLNKIEEIRDQPRRYHFYAEVLSDDGKLHGRSQGFITFGPDQNAVDIADELMEQFRKQRPENMPLPASAMLVIKYMSRL